MIRCELHEIDVNIETECRNNCILWRKDKCNYPIWFPGLKKGRDYSKEKNEN